VIAEDTARRSELVLAQLDRLPTLPAVALRALELTTADDSSAADLVKLLRADPSLTAKVLSIAGSAAVGARDAVTTLERAVPLLGFRTVRNVVLAGAVLDCLGGLSRRDADGPFDRAEFWKHALACACAAKRLASARREPAVAPEDAFVAGLLHDLGKIALQALFPKSYARIVAQTDPTGGDITDGERSVLGVDHTVAGRRLAERWRLPTPIVETIWLHHLVAESLPRTVRQPALISMVQLADTISREQRIGFSGNAVFFEDSTQLARRIGFSEEAVEDLRRRLPADVAEEAGVLGLERPIPEAMYAEAMSRANAQLARLNEDLLVGSRKLTAAARYFRAIIEFDRGLRDWSDPSDVVAAIARSAAAALQRSRIAVFGVRDNRTTIDVCATGAGGETGHHAAQEALGDVLEALDEFRAGTHVIVRAPELVRALAEPALASQPGTCWLLPIAYDGRVGGGVVFCSESDERERLAGEHEELRSYLTSLGLALARANAYAASRKLSEDLAESNRRLQQMQVELLRSRALSMIAEMAAGAGHELNSPLTVISGRAQLLASTIRDPEARRALELVVSKAHECSGIVTELMNFARPHPPELANVDLLELVTEVRDAFVERHGLPASKVAIEPAPVGSGRAAPGPAVRIDRGQIRTVLEELLSNAADAISATDGGITIRCEESAQHVGMAELLVRDTGCGMAPAVLQRAFDPFFSHRIAGRGRGLGLPRAYRIIEAHGGRIWLESRKDQGTTARVLLPAATA
jgi:signal transduction histidine kinase/HD-like signal output (HDOD) protein